MFLQTKRNSENHFCDTLLYEISTFWPESAFHILKYCSASSFKIPFYTCAIGCALKNTPSKLKEGCDDQHNLHGQVWQNSLAKCHNKHFEQIKRISDSEFKPILAGGGQMPPLHQDNQGFDVNRKDVATEWDGLAYCHY